MTPELISLKVKQLREMARAKHIKYWYKLTKTDLVAVLSSASAASSTPSRHSSSSHRDTTTAAATPSHHSTTTPSSTSHRQHASVPVTARAKPDLYPEHDSMTTFKHWFTEVDYGNKNANKWIKYYIKKHPSKETIHVATRLSVVKANKVIQKFLQDFK